MGSNRFEEHDDADSWLEKLLEFNPDEQEFWDDLIRRRDARIEESKKFYNGECPFECKAKLVSIEFYREELYLAIDGKQFGKRIAVERRLMTEIGDAFFEAGEFGAKRNCNPFEVANSYGEAARHYYGADGMVAMTTQDVGGKELKALEKCINARTFIEYNCLEREKIEDIDEWKEQTRMYQDRAEQLKLGLANPQLAENDPIVEDDICPECKINSQALFDEIKDRAQVIRLSRYIERLGKNNLKPYDLN
jgi:hypothetical protein